MGIINTSFMHVECLWISAGMMMIYYHSQAIFFYEQPGVQG